MTGRRGSDCPSPDPPAERESASTLHSDWARLGVAYPVPPSDRSPDLERLLIDTVRVARSQSRLFVMAFTWLRRHGAAVARHRLGVMARNELDDIERAVLGLLLTSTASTRCRNYREAVAACGPLEAAIPLFTVHERHRVLARRLEARATSLSRRWGVLAEPIEPKLDALRPTEWVLRQNPELALRTDLGGDLRSSILAELASDADAGASEVELARRCGASRIAVRQALDRLELAGHVRRVSCGRCRQIHLTKRVA